MKYDWKELEKEYLLGNYKSDTEFIKDKKLEDNTYVRTKMKNWKVEKRKNNEIIVKKTIEKTIENTAKEQAKQLATVNEVANILLQKISDATNNLQIERNETTKLRTLEYDNHGKVKREATVTNRKNTALELANALSTIASILASGTEKQEDKIDKYFNELSEVIQDGDN